MANLYDNLVIDIEAQHRKINEEKDFMSRLEHYLSIGDRLLHKAGYYQKMVDSGFKRDWFLEFSDYWTKALGARPLKFHDFFFLYSDYRKRFQSIEVGENTDGEEFLEAWQKPENIYLIFGSVYQNALEPFACLNFNKYLKVGDRILEYGCGLAPMTTSFIKTKNKDYSFTIADIKTFTYHYAKYRLRQHKVRFIDIEPFKRVEFDRTFNVIFLMAVLEHLPNPVEVIKQLTDNIEKDGYLIFNFVLGDGHGLDTKKAVDERREILDYINANYSIVEGNLLYEKSMGLTIGRKK